MQFHTGDGRSPPAPGREYGTHESERDECERTVAPDDLLELLGDEYTRRVLRVVAEEPRSARDVADETSVSRATAYRRLNELEEAGLVEARITADADGHHRNRFRAVLDEANLHLDADGFEASIEVAPTDATPGHAGPARRRPDVADD